MKGGAHYKNPGRTPQNQLPPAPIMLKGLLLDCNIKQDLLAKASDTSRPTISLCVNKGYIPLTVPGFKVTIEAFIAARPEAMTWLAERGRGTGAIWARQEEQQHRRHPKSTWEPKAAIIPGNPDEHDKEDTHMKKLKIPQEILRQHKLFKDPFQDDPRSDKEVFRSDEHRYIEYAMLDAAQNSGFLAIIGEVGSGKSVMRRAVIDQLRRDDRVRIIYPQIIDKTRITSSSLCDAIVRDLSSEKVKVRLEDKARHVTKLLTDRAAAGYRTVMIIEEAHDLTIPALKYLKRFNELEFGFQKLLGIILLGQSELSIMLDEAENPEIREVIRRIQIAYITGLNGSLYEYLAHRFRLVGADLEKIMTAEAVDALGKRLTIPGDGGRKVSQAYPLTVNNYVAAALIMAHQMGETIITPDVIHTI